jgi:ribosomal protein L40E
MRWTRGADSAQETYRRRLPPDGARCARCGSTEIACLPTFSVGAGVAYRPVADDVLCRRCGAIEPPDLGGPIGEKR